MDEYQSLNHTKWECKYHVVFIPQCRRRTLYVQLRQHLGEVLRRLAEQKPAGQQRQRRHEVLRRLAEQKESRAAFLGPRVLRVDRRAG